MQEKGLIKMIHSEKGYGFIRREEEADLFFHVSECQNKAAFEALKEGDAIEFDIGEGRKGKEGRNITLVIT